VIGAEVADPLEYLVETGQDDGPVIVLLHGRGADEGDLTPVGRMLSAEATVVTPRAPFPAAPWGYGPGWAWYRYLHGTTPEPESFAEGQRQLDAFLATIREAVGRPDAALVVGGFSQGGTSSLAWALRHPGEASAVLVFSGFLADHPMVEASPATVTGTPIWWGHGTADPAIPFQYAEAGWEALRSADATLETLAYEGAGHTITHEGLRSAAAFVDARVKGEG
jgi:phospholipase/carboxylesterase